MSETGAHEKRKWVRLTRACNNRCLFCLDEDALDGSMIPVGAVKAELAAGIRAGCRRAVLSGGEPTLHPKFLSIIRFARKIGYRRVQTVSNGRLFCYADFLKAAVLAGLGEITFSVHGETSRRHDGLVGIKGAFAQTMRGISNALRVPGLIVSSDVVVNKLNVDKLGDIIALLRKMGVNEYDLLQIMPFGRAWKNWGRLYYDPAAKKAELSRAFDYSRVPGLRLWTNRFRAELLEGRETLIQRPDKLLDEINGQRAMFEDFLRGTGPLYCRGERCRYCPLEGFCVDLRKLRDLGSLGSLPPPLCAGNSRGTRGSINVSAGLDAIGKFYIGRRLAVKGAACASCSNGKNCAGTGIFEVIRSGFGSMKPFKKEGRR